MNRYGTSVANRNYKKMPMKVLELASTITETKAKNHSFSLTEDWRWQRVGELEDRLITSLI